MENFLHSLKDLLLGYCINLCYFMILKTQGKDVEGHPVIEELIRSRVILEKLRPLDTKLKYQIEKLLKLANESKISDVQGAIKHIDPKLRHVPQISSFMNVEEEEEDENEVKDKSEQKYVPPKREAVIYEEANEKKAKEKERQRKRASGSRMAKMLLEEYGDTPFEENFGGSKDPFAEHEKRENEEYTTHEEEYFVRLDRRSLHKKQQARRKKVGPTGADFLVGLEDWNTLLGVEDDEDLSSVRTKQRSQNSDKDDIEEVPPRKRPYKNKSGGGGSKNKPSKRHKK
eukprot:TRINITY_DN1593_c0_g1_i15.p1 TRINITY_DN1593_c0_g1~~TRINITY_DN1593_c0_g1_i15.p1  ORF type:complete len:286 (-),score=99.15 TRINITY_DN1593_c0_g1_i15:144-1001(-)